MSDPRLTLALQDAPLDEFARIAVFGPPADADLSALSAAQVAIVQPFKPDHDIWVARGFTASPQLPESADAAIVFLPRAKAEARHLVATALRLTCGGPVWIDGQKTDGIDSMLKPCRQRGQVGNVISKAHGKCFDLHAEPADFDDWIAGQTTLPSGHITAPGVFSADGVDPASALLADALPDGLKGTAADFGAGWGFLSGALMSKAPAITHLDLIEADHASLECARRNVTDPRAAFHWADATRPDPKARYDVIISNPPFHTSRAADPALGRAFLSAAARALAPSGQFWLVANRHLPYERDLATLFANVEERPGSPAFKLFVARRPIGNPRANAHK
ncbi:hypothetical protein ACMU_14000 [Actibacterium mucosum KCTC 23349]|uniref:Uncharacterized protein n=1 Tax=Actibacterium mucosum KCTC 23349 TaxID=1454373 RepID=A0A037ZH64_9RHOB|nr:class I SAM-dependent methyltransferase [Actibacterium mucosum]KAJ54872.1 hypothetical protein ACMU_14000 [Actibacterium mucosum KCTC 23349]